MQVTQLSAPNQREYSGQEKDSIPVWELLL